MPDLESNGRPLADRLLGPRASIGKAGAPHLMQLAGAMKDVVALGRGDPDLPTPPHIVAAAEQALRAGHTHYTPLRGLPGLLEAIAAKLERDNGLQMDPSRQIMVTTGAQEAVAVAALTLLGPGDEWIMPDPYYFSYALAVKYAGGQVVPVPTRIDQDFQPDPEEIERRITPRTKAIVLLTPHNPTGTIYSRVNLERVADIARRRDLLVISDEIYEKIVFDGHEHFSIGTMPGMADRTITINGFSKSYRMTGWRIGYMAGPAEFVDAALTIKHTLSICAPSVSQHAALAALTGSQDCIEENVATFRQRRSAFLERMNEMGIPYFQSPAAFYVFADISWTGMTSDEFATDLLKTVRAFVYPGSCFGESGEGFVRISLLAPIPRLLEGLDRLADYLDRRQLVPPGHAKHLARDRA